MDHSTAHYRNIKEKYKIEATLGKGSFASVKQAKDRVTKERFAVKVLSKKSIKDEDLQAMKLEIDILKQLDHPNIVKLYDVYEDERFICLVMELMKGGELFQQIIDNDHFSESEAREAIKALIGAIHYCHQLDITHRDIKPENLLLSDKKQGITSMKLADFGLARMLEGDMQASTACGSPGYVAPEIISGNKYGKQCDNWSIGVVLFILLSGTPPFYDEEKASLFENISNCKYEFDEAWDQVSPEAKDFIAKILVPDPNVRMDTEKMMSHPWMTANLQDNKPLEQSKKHLTNFVSFSIGKSQKDLEQTEADENENEINEF